MNFIFQHRDKKLRVCYRRRDMAEDLVTVSEAARIKGVTRAVIYNAINRGDISARTVLGRRALRREDVDRWQPRRAGRRRGVPLSEDTKAKIAEAQRARWRQRKESEKETEQDRM